MERKRRPRSGNLAPRAAWEELNNAIVGCERCPRLREYCEQIGRTKRRSFQDQEYWTRPLANFGDHAAKILIVGLAPAAHGGNRTGRMFTGDRSGDWLYRALYKARLANQPHAVSIDDGLTLSNIAITGTCHCAPPDNKPTRDEIANCREWLTRTIDLLLPTVFVALGKIAFDAVVDEARRRSWLTASRPKFGHAAEVELKEERWLIGSYHPSQQNTFTGRLTEEMLDQVFVTAKRRSREID